jgi:hypothetical protein
MSDVETLLVASLWVRLGRSVVMAGQLLTETNIWPVYLR